MKARWHALSIATVAFPILVVAACSSADGAPPSNGATPSNGDDAGVPDTNPETATDASDSTDARTPKDAAPECVMPKGACTRGADGKSNCCSDLYCDPDMHNAQGGLGACRAGDTDLGIGVPCEASDDCSDGVTCITSAARDSLFGGGPAHGYCTKKNCTDDAQCGANAACTSVDGGKLCMRTCTQGPALTYINDPLDPEKCAGREDVACAVQGEGLPSVCFAVCGSDEDCPGAHCDPKANVCVDTAPAGKPIGAACTADDECAGHCVDVGPVKMCTQACVLGGDVSANDCNGHPHACIFPYTEDEGAGDVGVCTSICSKHDDCLAPTFACANVGGDLPGVCVGTTICTSNADCTRAGDTCLTTTVGNICGSSSYPLGSLAPTP